MSEELVKYPAGAMTRGIDVFQGNLTADLVYDLDTWNLTTGINEGVGPRYGTAPIPGHQDSEALAATAYPGLVAAESGMARSGTGSRGLTVTRNKVFNIHPLKMLGDGTINPSTKLATYYAAVIGYASGGQNYADVLLLSTNQSGTVVPSANIYDGLPPTGIDSPITTNFSEIRFALAGAGGAAALTAIDIDTDSVCSAPFSVSGIEVPMQWIIGSVKDLGGVSRAPSLAFGVVSVSGNQNVSFNSGVPAGFMYGSFSRTSRALAVYGMTNAAHQNLDYTIQTITPDTTIYKPLTADGGDGGTQIDLTGVGATKISSGTNYAANAMVVVNDPMMTNNSGHQGVLVATGKSAFAAVFQDWYRGALGDRTQYVDLTADQSPPSWSGTGLATNYQDSGAYAPTAFANWPVFIRGTGMVAAGTQGPALMAANTGLLRANTVYEFTFSLFNKRLNCETNVGTPVKIQTGATDFVGLQLFAFGATYATLAQYYLDLQGGPIPWPITGPSNTGTTEGMNHLEYRFYYRAEGMQEWLPALFIDAVKLWFYTHHTPLAACTGGIGGLPGGRPGGFSDYSPLPKDNWDCCLMWQGRAFWLSAKQAIFSLRNNIFAYPARNSMAAPSGSFKGAILHTYYGQAQQGGRMVVFGDDTVYVGRFSGNQLQVPVQVSATSEGNFYLDGSDFTLDPWTSNTAFSYRSAIVAKGVLFWWGPDGIFRDDGVNIPPKISDQLEPDIFSLYDPSKTDQIHATYNDKTKEVIWFYTPKVADGYATHGLVYDTIQQTFLRVKFKAAIDRVTDIAIATPIGTAGDRKLLTARPAVGGNQRAYFFDHFNRSGDMLPGSELLVKQVASSGTNWLLTLAAGSADPTAAAVAAGDYLLFQQLAQYTGQSTWTDMVAKVVAATSTSLTVTLPPGAVLGAITATASQRFPVWHMAKASAGMNGIPFQLKTKYWMPGGVNMSMMWMYLYLSFNTKLFPYIDPPDINVAYRTPVSGTELTDVLQITDNSDGNCQFYHPQRLVDRSIEGQAMRWTVSGNHIGHPWVLQWLEAHGNQQVFNFLKEFEG